MSSEQRPIPDAAYWKKLRDCYFAAKKSKGREDPHDVELRETFKEATQIDGSLVECEARQGPYGRGVYSKNFIEKGTPVWRCEQYGIFRKKKQWERFLSSLPHFMQYDVATWAYVLDWGTKDCPQVIGLDLEPSTLFNHGGSDVTDIDETIAPVDLKPANIECVGIPNSDDEWHYIAAADIQPDEELLCDYSKFHVYNHKLFWFDDAHDFIVEEEMYYPISSWAKLKKRLGLI